MKKIWTLDSERKKVLTLSGVVASDLSMELFDGEIKNDRVALFNLLLFFFFFFFLLLTFHKKRNAA